ncbi:hypothetical protein [Microbacterium sp. LWS13-1.2]|uniref:Uncharacterized protein n=1 Tax=Microbacterium sp. LWS13-1.2 TaxID=3135264 RepID=A0AAU6SH34_9MICO
MTASAAGAPPDPFASVPAQLAASEAARLALAGELTDTRRALYIERALRRHPAIEPALDLLTGATAADIERQVAKLASLAEGSRAPTSPTNSL